jgi:uncharacterized protein YbcC (UPF0753/DUF2309 family)
MRLAGRSFLHDYCHRQDENHAVLETLLTGPLAVASALTLRHFALPADTSHEDGRPGHASRLTVAVEAPPTAIDDIIRRHPGLMSLVDNDWVQMHAIDPEGALWRRRRAGAWAQVMTTAIGAAASEAA